jgi:hypothetical protein
MKDETTKKLEEGKYLCQKPLFFLIHPIITRPHVPTQPAPVNHEYRFLSSFFLQMLKVIMTVVSFLCSFSRKDKLTNVIDTT